MRTLLVAAAAGLLLTACTSNATTSPTSSPSPTDARTNSPTPSPSVSPSSGSTSTAPSPTDTEPRDTDTGPPADLTATLSGAAVEPGPGDATGSGTFRATLTPGEASAELCYTLTIQDLESPVTAAHIHHGAAGTSGNVVVALDTPVGGTSEGCVVVQAGDALGLIETAADYYVQVHSESNPDGAVRGQLEAGG
jgi:hypothetical protein